MPTLSQDLRFGVRMLMKKPGFTLIAVATLALGIGATTAIFSVVNAVLLRPLPFPDAERLVYVGQQYPGGLSGSGEPKFLFWRERAQSFEALTAIRGFGGASGNLVADNSAEYINGRFVSADYFRVFSVRPALGRAFSAQDDSPQSDRVALLSNRLWRKSFGANASILGQTMRFNDQAVTIIGVMPEGFRKNDDIDLYMPLRAVATNFHDPNSEVIGKLKPGVSIEQAQAEMKLIAEQYRAAFPKHMQNGESVTVRSYQEMSTGNSSLLLWSLLGAVTLLLLIACANVANLQLSQAAGRQREFVVRRALGASRWRITQQLLIEGLLLALVGGACGILLAVWSTSVIAGWLEQGYVPLINQVTIDGRTLLFSLLAALVTGVLFGLSPAWQATRTDLQTTLKEGGGKGGTTRGRLRNGLVVAEIALSVVLLAACGLLVRSFINLLNVPTGFDPENVLVMRINPSGERYDATGEAANFFQAALARLRATPGVESVAVTNILPLRGQFNMPVFLSSKPDALNSVQVRFITPEYFDVMKIPVRQGRAFSTADNPAASPVAIVNEAFVQRMLNGQAWFSQVLSVGRNAIDAPRQIVGVVGDVKQRTLNSPAPPMVYLPLPQLSDRLYATFRTFTTPYFVVRTQGTPTPLAPAFQRAVADQDATLPLFAIGTLQEVLGEAMLPTRVNVQLFGLFAALGLLLAVIGLYGVISYGVAQRTQEIGIRLALGAQGRDVLRLILRQGFQLAVFGTAGGLLAAWGVTRWLRTLLYGVTANDPLTFAVIAGLLLSVSLLACFLPARRATKVDPMIALRCE